MPYEKQTHNNKICIVNQLTGKPVKCYPRNSTGREKARRLIAALYANVDDADQEATVQKAIRVRCPWE